MTPPLMAPVRLKARPDKRGIVTQVGAAEGRVMVSGIGYRYSEELELDGEPMKAGRLPADIGPFRYSDVLGRDVLVPAWCETLTAIEAPSTSGEAARVV